MNAGKRATVLAVIAVLASAALSRSLAAQVVRGTVIDSTNRQPISGAVVTLLDAGGAVLGQNITNELGEFGVTSGRGAKSIRIVRIGFQPRDLSFDNAADPGRALDVTMVPFTTTLATVRITEKSNCPQDNERTAAFAFWDQARAGLLNSVVARKANPMSLHRLYFSRALDAATGSIKTFTVNEDSTSSTQTSFTSARSAAELVRRGFAGDPGLVVGYMFGPDADILLADAFAQGYCFRVAEPDKSRPGQIGVAFAAADFRGGRVDIEGTIWIDTVARALRDAEFRYVGMPQVAEQFHPGGTMSFATAANGVVFIDRWSLRLIGNAPFPVYSPSCRTTCGMQDSFYPAENGAEVSHAVWRKGLRWDAHLGAVSIHATAGGRPAARTALQLANSPYHGTTDTSGTLRIVDLLPGPYAARVRDPRLAGLGVLLPTSAKFTAARDSTVELSLDVPTVEDFVAGQCRASGKWTPADSTYLLGRVVDNHDNPLAGVRVTFAVRQGKDAWVWDKKTLTTDADGVFATCAPTLNRGSTLQIRAESEHSWPRSVTHEITAGTSIVPVRVDARP